MNGENIELLHDCDIELKKISIWIESHKLDSNIKYLVSYAVIKSCGTIEHVLKSTLYEYLSNGTPYETQNFLQKQILEASFNPSSEKINQLLKNMNRSWNDEFKNRTRGSDDKEKLDSLISLRNDFAHGSVISATITNVIDYYNSAKTIISCIDDIISPAGVAGGV